MGLCVLYVQRHDTQHNDINHNDTKHEGHNFDTQQNVIPSVTFYCYSECRYAEWCCAECRYSEGSMH
jgi:hypothetical protein